MDLHSGIPGARIPGRSIPIVPVGVRVRLGTEPATAPQAPCDDCYVRHLCLPAGLDARSSDMLRGLRIGRKRLRKGQRLYRAGEPFVFLYAVRFGTFKSSLPLADGSEQVTSFHLAGDLMGFDGAAQGTHATSAVALENAEACAIPYAQLLEACADSQPLRRRVAQAMAALLVREYSTSKLIARCYAEARVAGFLLLMAQWMQERGFSPREFQLRMSRADIGSYLGTSLETVSRSLSLFDRLGLVHVRSRHIEVLRPDALREHASA